MKTLSFHLTDDGDTVELEIQRDSAATARYKNFAPSGIRVREPLPDKDALLATLRGLASSGHNGGTVEGNLEFYIQSQYQAIARQVVEIEKAIKRIEKQHESIRLAREWLSETTNAI